MGNTMFPGLLQYEFERHAINKAKIADKESRLMAKFNSKISDQTIREIIDIVQKYGKPIEQKQARLIKERYENGDQLEFDEVMLLNQLYNACKNCLPNKEGGNE